MQALIVLTLTFGLLWVLFLLPQKRQVRAHQQLVAELNEGDEVILSAGIFGRITTSVSPAGLGARSATDHDHPHDLTDPTDPLDQNETPDPPTGDRA